GTATPLTGWKIYCLPLDNQMLASLRFGPATPGTPAFWRSTFTVEKAGDVFVDLTNCGKGVVWVNGHCLGRYWNIGPTQTAYLPGPWVKAGANEIVILGLVGPQEPVMVGLDKPVLDHLRPELDFSHSNLPFGLLL